MTKKMIDCSVNCLEEHETKGGSDKKGGVNRAYEIRLILTITLHMVQ